MNDESAPRPTDRDPPIATHRSRPTDRDPSDRDPTDRDPPTASSE